MGVSICCRGYSMLLDRCSELVPGRGASLPVCLSACLAHFATTNLGLLIVLEEFPPPPALLCSPFYAGITHCLSQQATAALCLMCVIVEMLGRHLKSNFRSSVVLVYKPTSGISIIQD
jgi:hypothetical protein